LRSLRGCCLRKGRSHLAPAARHALFIHRAAAETCEKAVAVVLFSSSFLNGLAWAAIPLRQTFSQLRLSRLAAPYFISVK
jgi:hypothetical protein